MRTILCVSFRFMTEVIQAMNLNRPNTNTISIGIYWLPIQFRVLWRKFSMLKDSRLNIENKRNWEGEANAEVVWSIKVTNDLHPVQQLYKLFSNSILRYRSKAVTLNGRIASFAGNCVYKLRLSYEKWSEQYTEENLFYEKENNSNSVAIYQ